MQPGTVTLSGATGCRPWPERQNRLSPETRWIMICGLGRGGTTDKNILNPGPCLR